MAHRLTHLPFRPWCTTCIAAKAVDSPHYRLPVREDELEVVEFHYCYIQADQATTLPALVSVTKKTGYGQALVVKVKGRQDKNAVGATLRYLEEAGVTAKARFRSDSEQSIRSFVQEVAKQGGSETIIEVTPKASSSSLGAGECYIKRVMGTLRTLVAEFEAYWKRPFPVQLLPHAVVYSA